MSSKVCEGIGRTVYAHELEQSIKREIENKIGSLSITSPANSQTEINREIEKIRIAIGKLDDKISAIVEKVESADVMLMKYINKKMAELESQKQEFPSRLCVLENT